MRLASLHPLPFILQALLYDARYGACGRLTNQVLKNTTLPLAYVGKDGWESLGLILTENKVPRNACLCFIYKYSHSSFSCKLIANILSICLRKPGKLPLGGAKELGEERWPCLRMHVNLGRMIGLMWQ